MHLSAKQRQFSFWLNVLSSDIILFELSVLHCETSFYLNQVICDCIIAYLVDDCCFLGATMQL